MIRSASESPEESWAHQNKIMKHALTKFSKLPIIKLGSLLKTCTEGQLKAALLGLFPLFKVLIWDLSIVL